MIFSLRKNRKEEYPEEAEYTEMDDSEEPAGRRKRFHGAVVFLLVLALGQHRRTGFCDRTREVTACHRPEINRQHKIKKPPLLYRKISAGDSTAPVGAAER